MLKIDYGDSSPAICSVPYVTNELCLARIWGRALVLGPKAAFSVSLPVTSSVVG